MTIRDIIIKYSQELEKISDTPRLDVELFLQKALGGVDRIYIHLNLNKELTTEQYDEFIKYINDRINGRPVAYIVGNREFMGLDFFVKEGVLIPRPDTETLVEEIINICNNKSELNILDIGTGSGAITISLAKYLDKSHVISADISDIALEIASKNEITNNVDERKEFIKSYVFSNLPKEEKFDLVISNRSMLEITNLPKLKSFWSIDEVENSIVVANSVLKFFKSVEKVMTHDAKLITFERLDGLEEILNFIKSMHASGLYADTDAMCKIQFNELNDVEQMPLIVFDKTERDEIGFYDAIEIYNKLPILNKQKDIEDEFAIELQFKALGEKELVYGTQIDYKTGVGSERREVWKVGDKYVTYKYSNVGRRELVTEGIEKDKAINEIRAMSNFIGRIGHKVTEYHSIEEREKLVK